jgi:hypothetical protein
MLVLSGLVTSIFPPTCSPASDPEALLRQIGIVIDGSGY